MYVGYMSYMSYVSYMSIFMNRLKLFEVSWYHLTFVFKKFRIFLLLYKHRKPKL